MKIIYGAVRPDAGSIAWKGELARIASPGEARAMGIAMVFQHFALFDSITVVENMALALPGKFDLRAWRRALPTVIAALRGCRSIHGGRSTNFRSASASAWKSFAVCCSRPSLLIMTSPPRC